MQYLIDFFNQYVDSFRIPDIGANDIVEILILSFVFYNILVWIKDTRAWMLMKGLVVLVTCIMIAYIFQLNTILWLGSKTLGVGITAIIIVFQPELRKALEQLGRKNIVLSLLPIEETKSKNEKFSEKTINEILKATYDLAKTKTGALMVVEQDIVLSEYERTGIPLDSLISSQLLINIFEHNTPLHDGAIIIRGNRIVSATCYLPLSDNMELSKELGTRHRAGVGISEVTDSITIIVSEETGKVSIAKEGKLIRNVDDTLLKEQFVTKQENEEEGKRFKLWKGRRKGEGKTDK